jgi:hypothetical protein
MSQANAIAREITGGGFDMVLTSSTPSLQAVATAHERGSVLHVFAAVADPFSAGVGLDRSDPLAHPRHLLGYGSLAPVDVTLRIGRDGVLSVEVRDPKTGAVRATALRDADEVLLGAVRLTFIDPSAKFIGRR